ncbi:uncharacterized protein TRIADDRAFT_55680 [Trichoplax adhaerens]|uniref:Uncharacterized protein n=1 Tax=Trichoplax adhaerens TaxID=10228 RepID=B3RVJ9_TRIAD|nr:hypothetical protein TRIADDRAFT_55680 [Trichoplax adhaerens]EDV26009.1 hypothetical protein TRIADDRAFT_55680 [Trichoplax adhaerens]|eukprot:XP_002112042.1 hypothetical protein TRIADDRAFT_55680 [Trichoplax adhaerens]
MGLQKEIKHLESRLAKIQELNKDLNQEAEICNALGELYFRNGEYRKAVKIHREELILCEALNDRLGVAIANRKIGENLCELRQFDQALDHVKEHLKIAREVARHVYY